MKYFRKKRVKKKLGLNKVTIAHLEDNEINEIRGGGFTDDIGIPNASSPNLGCQKIKMTS
ncbi:MAG: hypothetical protein GY757_60875 [bacterium]|nr:hypothetical protein [bacterium]